MKINCTNQNYFKGDRIHEIKQENPIPSFLIEWIFPPFLFFIYIWSWSLNNFLFFIGDYILAFVSFSKSWAYLCIYCIVFPMWLISFSWNCFHALLAIWKSFFSSMWFSFKHNFKPHKWWIFQKLSMAYVIVNTPWSQTKWVKNVFPNQYGSN